jgi:hypothetical protein
MENLSIAIAACYGLNMDIKEVIRAINQTSRTPGGSLNGNSSATRHEL